MGRHTKGVSKVDESVDSEEDSAPPQPLYARMLGLTHISPGPVACFFLFEGIIGLTLLLALAGWVSWWGLAIIPIAVGAMVKLNDIVAGKIVKIRSAKKGLPQDIA